MISLTKISIIILSLLAYSCTNAEFVAPETYDCMLSFPDESTIHPNRESFQVLLDQATRDVPGVMVALRTPDGNTWNGTSGMADIPNNVPLQNCHKMMIGSISKVFTSTLIFQLQEEDLLSIEDPLNQWIDRSITDQIENANVVSLRQLLNHTSGLYDYNNWEFTLDATNNPNMILSLEEKLKYAYGKPATHAPGRDYEYSNTNFVLLGMVIEAASGLELGEALQTYIFDPLNVTSATYGSVETPLPTGVVRPYFSFKSGKYIDIRHVEVSDANTGDGGIAINMQDLRVFIEALFDGQLLGDETFRQMTTTLYEKPEGEEDFEEWDGESTGLGIDLFRTEYGEAYGHTGGIFGFHAYLFHFPEQDATLAIAYNGQDVNSDEYVVILRKELMRLMFE